MKLLFITNNFPPISCGVGDYTYYLAKEFVKNGHKVQVVCRRHPDIEKQWVDTKDHLKVHPIGGSWQKSDWNKLLEYIATLKPTHVLFQYVPGAYQKHTVPWHLIYFFKALKQLPVKVITTFHETYVRYNFKHPKYLYVALGQRYIARYIAQHSHRLVTSIDRYARQLKPWNQQVSIIPIGSNIPPIHVAEAEMKALRQQLAPNGERIICTFGNRHHMPLVNLFKELLAQEPNVVLLIIGKLNGQLDGLSAQVRNKIYVTGFLEANEVFKYLKISNLFFNVTEFRKKGGANNKSGALAAAFAAGLPIVGLKGDMTNNLLLRNSKITWLSLYDVKKCLDDISQILNTKGLQEELSQSSLNFYNDFISWKKIQLEYQRVLDNYEKT